MGRSDTEIYCACMGDLLQRLQLIRSICVRTLTTGHELFDGELVFLQFRKILEQLAFASLAANKEAYAAARAKFAGDWRAKKILDYVESLNPEFYPQPFTIGSFSIESGHRHFQFKPLEGGFLTKEEFAELYEYCTDILHARNPYSGGSTIINTRLSALEWLDRIERLISLHRVRLISGACWLGAVPDKDGKVHTYTAEPLAHDMTI
jgi:hypothetical protein